MITEPQATFQGLDRTTVDAAIRIGRALALIDESWFFDDGPEATAWDIIKEAQRIDRLPQHYDPLFKELERIVLALHCKPSTRPNYVIFEVDAQVVEARGLDWLRDEHGRNRIGPTDRGYAIHELQSNNDSRRRYIVTHA